MAPHSECNVTHDFTRTPQQWRHIVNVTHSRFHLNSPTVEHLSLSPLPQLDYEFKMNRAEWYVGWATRFLLLSWNVIATVHLSTLCKIRKRMFFCSYAHFQSKHYPQLYAIEIERCIDTIMSLPNGMMMSRICTSHVSYGSGEIMTYISYITFTMWRHWWVICCFSGEIVTHVTFTMWRH